MKKLFFAFLGLCFLGTLALGGAYLWLTRIYATTAAPLAQEQTIIIEPGTGGERIGAMLAAAGVIEHPQAFRALAVLAKKHQSFKAGEYVFVPGMTPLGVIDKLARGEVVRHQVTIPEGKTSTEIARILAAHPVLIGEVTALPPEGSLLPETYDFLRGTTRAEMLQRMAAAQHKALEDLWPGRAVDLPFATPQEALTLASIVEKETGQPEERPRIAGVYINRLKIGMPLQADPTVAYGIYGGQYADKPLTASDLKTDTPYNTYTRKGLPLGPICHPGKAAIAAVLNPMLTKELYFVAVGDGSGGHRFAETLDQHNANVAEYRKLRRSSFSPSPAR